MPQTWLGPLRRAHVPRLLGSSHFPKNNEILKIVVVCSLLWILNYSFVVSPGSTDFHPESKKLITSSENP